MRRFGRYTPLVAAFLAAPGVLVRPAAAAPPAASPGSPAPSARNGALILTTDSPLVADSLTAAGLAIAPRYLARPGDVDLSLEGHVVSVGRTSAFEYGQIRQVRLPGDLVLLTGSGPLTTVALRGPLWERSLAIVGWDLRYRADSYPEEQPGAGGQTPPGLYVPPKNAGIGILAGAGGFIAGSQSQGGQASLEGEYDWRGISAFLAPEARVMTNRLAAGGSLAVDDRLGPVSLGLGIQADQNFRDPSSSMPLNPFETRFSVGLRWFPFNWGYLQASYHFVPADTYGFRAQDVEFGVGTRLLDTFAPPEPERLAAPAATGSSSVHGLPVPPCPGTRASIVGRLRNSLLGQRAKLGALAVHLKEQQGNRWIEIPQASTTDTDGRFEFEGLATGSYEVVYRDQGQLTDQIGAEVSDPVQISGTASAHVVMDLAWNQAATTGYVSGRTVDVRWLPKPALENLVYQVILKYKPDDPYVVGTTPGPTCHVQLTVSNTVARHRLYYTIKFWRKGHHFAGAAAYGQSAYEILKRNPGQGSLRPSSRSGGGRR